MRSTTAQSTIDQMRLWFAAYGLPEEVVSDNSFPSNSLISLNRMELNKHWYFRTIHRFMGQQNAQSRS